MKKNKITKERWDEAQESEIKCHIFESIEESIERYRKFYQKYFEYLGIDKNLNNRKILEIGPARISALLFCENYGHSYIVEPTVYEESKKLYENLPITFIHEIYETCNSPEVDEIWLLNVLQHIVDPDEFIIKVKNSAKIVRFFEPIDTEIHPHHPHSFSQEDYINYFGDCVQLYDGGQNDFHTARCVYGIYKNY
jgi:hypothetical protein